MFVIKRKCFSIIYNWNNVRIKVHVTMRKWAQIHAEKCFFFFNLIGDTKRLSVFYTTTFVDNRSVREMRHLQCDDPMMTITLWESFQTCSPFLIKYKISFTPQSNYKNRFSLRTASFPQKNHWWTNTAFVKTTQTKTYAHKQNNKLHNKNCNST